MKEDIESVCEKCGEDLVDRKKSNENWTVTLCVCPKCGTRQSMKGLLEYYAAHGQEARKKYFGKK